MDLQPEFRQQEALELVLEALGLIYSSVQMPRKDCSQPLQVVQTAQMGLRTRQVVE